jgi:tetratricopeptide (TPR) repeat protein
VEAVTGDPVVETRIASKRGSLLEHAGEYADAHAVYERALARLDELGRSPELLRNRTDVELGIAGVLYRQGRFDDAIEWAARAAADAEQVGDRGRLAHSLYLSAAAHNELGRPDGIRLCELALPIYVELADHRGQGRTLNNLGIALYYAGRWDEAVDAYRRGREALTRSGDVIEESTLANNEGEILSDQGHLAEADEVFGHFLRTCRAAGYTMGEAGALNNLARCAARGGRFEEAQDLFADAIEQLARIGATSFAAEARARSAECLVFAGRYREAIDLLKTTEPGELGEATRMLSERVLGYALHQARQTEEAQSHLEASAALAREAGSDFELALSQQALVLTRHAGDAVRAASEATLQRLGVVFTRTPPLP